MDMVSLSVGDELLSMMLEGRVLYDDTPWQVDDWEVQEVLFNYDGVELTMLGFRYRLFEYSIPSVL